MNCSGVVSDEQAIASMSYLDRRHEILQTFSGKLFDPTDGNGAIKQSMAQRITGRIGPLVALLVSCNLMFFHLTTFKLQKLVSTCFASGGAYE